MITMYCVNQVNELHRTCLIIVGLVFLQFNMAAAQGNGKIAGRIYDRDSNDPIISANIVIDGTSIGTVSDIDGNYFILNVPVGTVSLTATCVGYSKLQKIDVYVSGNKTTTVNFGLAQEMVQISEVTVKAERPIVVKDRTASEQIITSDKIEKSFVRTIPELLETQTGVFQRLYRGSSQVQSTYLLNNVSLNSGLLSDNYSGINTSSIQEIAVLTGGYNAEYGNARSAIISVTTKEGIQKGIHGTALVRMKPAGQYHYGRNMYSKENYDWAHYDLSYWTTQSQDPTSPFYGLRPDSLTAAWQKQITPNDTLADYTKRNEFEYEGTIFGSLTEEIGFLLSGRYKKGVGIFPQAIPYNTDYNIQSNISIDLSSAIKIKINGLYGGWESADLLPETNFNSLESAAESQWLEPMVIKDPYDENKYSLFGAIERQWPEQRRWIQYGLKMTHILSTSTFYEVQTSYLRDKMDRSDRYGAVPADKWTDKDDVKKMIGRFIDQSYFHFSDKSFSNVLLFKGDITSQIDFHNQIKSGFEIKMYDFSYQHWMSQYEGGKRWNLNNIFDGKPYEGTLYIQNKIEFTGLIVNIGIRADMFDQDRMAPAFMFDPLAYQLTTPGHDSTQPNGIPGTPERVKTKAKWAIAPRLGISHPITDNTVLHFFYGHFYQRPSWTKMFGFPFINYTEDNNSVFNPYAKQITYMDQWQGYYGNPEMGYERTIQYEIGIDQNLEDFIHLKVNGYYKDASNEARNRTYLFTATNSYNRAMMLTNSGYSDVRGIESEVETRFVGYFNVGLSHDIYWSWRGGTGFTTMYEPLANKQNIPRGNDRERAAWSSFNKVKGWISINVPEGGGMEVFGIQPFSDVNSYTYFWWREGEPYTYHAPGDVSTEPNNMRWYAYYQINQKLAKGFTFSGLRIEVSCEIRNILNSKFYRLFSATQLKTWHERTDLPERDRLPKHGFSGEPNEWNWYSYEVPPRQVYFQVRLDF